MAKKVIRVPKGWRISYCDIEGNTQKLTLAANKEYRIAINNGGKVYPIITVDKVRHDTKENCDVIVPKLELHPGYKSPVRKAVCGVIPVNQITSIEEVKTSYKVERRTKKEIDLDKTGGGSTFSFDKKNGEGQAFITIFPGEMVALSVMDDRPNSPKKTRNIYCTFKGYDEAESKLVVTRYIAVNGVRQITEDYKIALEDLIAIFRFKLVEDEIKPEETDDSGDNGGSDQTPTEETAEKDPVDNDDTPTDEDSEKDLAEEATPEA